MEPTVTTTMLDDEFVSRETFQDREQHWLSPISSSRAARLESHLIILAREGEGNLVKIDRMPEA